MSSSIQEAFTITGMGVRSSVYIQAFLGPAAIWTQYARHGELETDSNRTIILIFDRLIGTLFFAGVALFITATTNAKSTAGLSSVEGLVILNLLWIVNTTMLSLNITTYVLGWTGPCPGSTRQRAEQNQFRKLRGWWNIYPFFVIIHSILLGAFGLWFWASPSSFFSANDTTYYWIFSRISIDHSPLRKASLVIYSISVIPFINTILHAIIILSIPAFITSILMATLRRFDNTLFEYSMHATALLTFLFPPVYFIVSTEAVIKVNSFGGENVLNAWTLGDTVFLLITLLSVRSVASLTMFPYSASDAVSALKHPATVNSKSDSIAVDVTDMLKAEKVVEQVS